MITRTCDTCGYVGSYQWTGTADYHFPRHSCARELAKLNAPGRMAPPGEKRECTCPRARHEHGDYGMYVADKCRCSACRATSRARAALVLRRRAYDRRQHVDAEPARAHVNSLRAAGMGVVRIAKKSGVSASIVSRLVWGSPTVNAKPTVRMRRDSVARLLAVTLDVSPRSTVDGTGTRRRLQALAVMGWSQTALAAHSTVNRSHLGELTRGDQDPWKQTADSVRDLYDRLWTQQPPARSRWEQMACTRTTNQALAVGWVGPLAWDDDDIDNPDATPYRPKKVGAKDGDPERKRVDAVLVQRALSGVRVTANPAERAEIIRRWRAAGRPLAELDRQQGWNVHRDRRRSEEAA